MSAGDEPVAMYEYDPRKRGLEFQSDRTSAAGDPATVVPRAWGSGGSAGGSALSSSCPDRR